MQVINGHLTATEKKHIKQILAANGTTGKTKMKRYHITHNDDGTITVEVQSYTTKWVGDNVAWHKDTHVIRL